MIAKFSAWKDTTAALELGWESIFGDINGDGFIGTIP